MANDLKEYLKTFKHLSSKDITLILSFLSENNRGVEYVKFMVI